MARPTRIEYEGAVYHVMARANARASLFLTGVSQRWIAERLQMGHPVNVGSFCLKIDRAQKPLAPNVDRATKLIENLRSLT